MAEVLHVIDGHSVLNNAVVFTFESKKPETSRGGGEWHCTWSLRHLAEGKALFKAIRSRAELTELIGASPFVFLSNEQEVGRAPFVLGGPLLARE